MFESFKEPVKLLNKSCFDFHEFYFARRENMYKLNLAVNLRMTLSYASLNKSHVGLIKSRNK